MTERRLRLFHETDTVPDQPESHASLQQHKTGSNFLQIIIDRIGEDPVFRHENIAHLHDKGSGAVERREFCVVCE